MPKVLYVAAHRPGRSPSQRFRFEQYISFLQENGFEYDFSFLISENHDVKFYSKGFYLLKLWVFIKSFFIRCYDVLRASKYDVIYVQREAFMTGTSFFEEQFSKRSKLIFDFDDSIWLPNVSGANKNLEFLKDYSKTDRIVRASHLVIAGNQYLYDYAKLYNKNVVIIPTTIDTDYHIPNKQIKNKICIGWTGTMTTIPHFEELIPTLEKLKQKYKDMIYFKLIVNQKYEVASLGLQSTIWNKITEIEDIQEFDIGIMPLPEDNWAEGKCGFKGLQYMSLEIPTVMYPLGVNKQIIEDGINGYLASNESEWIEKLSLLIENELLRNELGKKGRQTIIKRYSVKSQKEAYLKAFTSLVSK